MIAGLATCLLACLVAWCPAVIAGQQGALHILLTNDDGIDSPGLEIFSQALASAGHRVTLVAPLRQQSGTGAHVSFKELTVARVDEARWSVEGRPADAVLIGVQGVLAGAPPDLVVSGPNFGQNLGANIVNSGTVGGAMMAVQERVPAIAVSVGLDIAERRAEPVHFPSTIAAFPRAARFTVALIERLVQRRAETGQLLPPGLLLNVNLPLNGAAVDEAVRVAPLGRYGGFRLSYPPVRDDSEVRTAFAYDERGFAERGSDTSLFAAGHTTVSVVEPPWPVDRSLVWALERWLAVALGDNRAPPPR